MAGRLRVVAACLLAGVAALWVTAHVVPFEARSGGWAGAAALVGLVSPVVGYRLYVWLGTRLPRRAAEAEVDAAWARATVVALAVTEAAALLCAVAFLLTRDPATYLGPAMHVLLTGALWPGPERRNAFAGLADPPEPSS